jgi:hypothetical protein
VPTTFPLQQYTVSLRLFLYPLHYWNNISINLTALYVNMGKAFPVSQFPLIFPEFISVKAHCRLPVDAPNVTWSVWSETAIKKNSWHESASELYRPSDRRLSVKLVPTWGQRVPCGQRDGSLRPYSRFPRQKPLLFYQVAPQLYSWGWVDPVPDPLLFFFWYCLESNPGLRICRQELWPLDNRGGRSKRTRLQNVIVGNVYSNRRFSHRHSVTVGAIGYIKIPQPGPPLHGGR